MYDVVVAAFDSNDKATQALADLQDISAGAGYAVIQAGVVKKGDDGLLLVDEFTGQGVDDQFMGLAAKTVVAAGASNGDEAPVSAIRTAIDAAPAALVITVYDPDHDAFDAFFAQRGARLTRWDAREIQKAMHEVRKAEGEAYRAEHRAEKHELHEEHKAARHAAFEEFKKDINL